MFWNQIELYLIPKRKKKFYANKFYLINEKANGNPCYLIKKQTEIRVFVRYARGGKFRGGDLSYAVSHILYIYNI